MRGLRATTYLLWLLIAGPALSQGSLEVIPLRHATAEQVLPALRPLLEPGGVLAGQRNQLIVRTSPRNLEEIRRALAVLDAPARRLEILVRFDEATAGSRTELGVEADLSRRSSRVVITGRGTRAQSAGRVDQRVQVLEGGRAFIAAGSSRPLQIRDGVVIREAATGFEVVPRLAGSMVILEIAPQRQSQGAGRGTVEALRAATTVRARLGEWVEIGGIDASGAAARRIWVRVEEVGP